MIRSRRKNSREIFLHLLFERNKKQLATKIRLSKQREERKENSPGETVASNFIRPRFFSLPPLPPPPRPPPDKPAQLGAAWFFFEHADKRWRHRVIQIISLSSHTWPHFAYYDRKVRYIRSTEEIPYLAARHYVEFPRY